MVVAVAVPQDYGVGNGVRLGLLQASLGRTMEYCAGIDVSFGKRELMRCGRNRENRSQGQGRQRARDLDRMFRGLGIAVTRIGLEAGQPEPP